MHATTDTVVLGVSDCARVVTLVCARTSYIFLSALLTHTYMVLSRTPLPAGASTDADLRALLNPTDESTWPRVADFLATIMSERQTILTKALQG